jgi:hypothetical protein
VSGLRLADEFYVGNSARRWEPERSIEELKNLARAEVENVATSCVRHRKGCLEDLFP